ncbi:hypothetical protein KHF85_02365 [Xanthomonas translucens pv. graminis]|uniref:hypothetical protein n=1 Tax=Xanthomonas graminis TaxID=3390026 RepID=UPI00253FEA7D|nr:hypothetical protein [Xanthomonas translucens]WIH05380.1 hypothetical protein KHF85_02365 [Xanthomonas translucens pv. graminis]
MTRISVLFYPGEVLPALKEAAQESLLAPLGLLFVAFCRRPSRVLPPPSSRTAVLAFWLTLGRGYATHRPAACTLATAPQKRRPARTARSTSC